MMRSTYLFLPALCAALAVSCGARADVSILLDGVYSGSWKSLEHPPDLVSVLMDGTDPNAPSGFNTISIGEEAFTVDGLTLAPRITWINLLTDTGDSLTGGWNGIGQINDTGTTPFWITGGTGAFAGAQGGGNVTINNTYAPPAVSGASRITIRGNVVVPGAPVPEPSSAALLIGPGFIGVLMLRRGRSGSLAATGR